MSHTKLSFSRQGQKVVQIKSDQNHVNFSSLSDFAIEEKKHLGIGIKYVSQGQETYLVDGQKVQVGAGQYVLINHNQSYGVEVRSAKAVDGVCVYLNSHMIADLLAQYQKSHRELLDQPAATPDQNPLFFNFVQSSQNCSLGRYLDTFSTNKSAQVPDHLSLPDNFFQQVAINLVESQLQLRKRISHIQAEKASTREEVFRRLLLSLSFIHDNWQQPIQVRDIAQAGCLSTFHFMRLFKQVYLKSPHQYLLALRMSEARSMIQENHFSLPEIADQCGYQSYDSFRKSFLKHFGQSPGRYRTHFQQSYRTA